MCDSCCCSVALLAPGEGVGGAGCPFLLPQVGGGEARASGAGRGPQDSIRRPLSPDHPSPGPWVGPHISSLQRRQPQDLGLPRPHPFDSMTAINSAKYLPHKDSARPQRLPGPGEEFQSPPRPRNHSHGTSPASALAPAPPRRLSWGRSPSARGTRLSRWPGPDCRQPAEAEGNRSPRRGRF